MQEVVSCVDNFLVNTLVCEFAFNTTYSDHNNLTTYKRNIRAAAETNTTIHGGHFQTVNRQKAANARQTSSEL